MNGCSDPSMNGRSGPIIDIEKEDWARKMQQLLYRACNAANLAREREIALNALRPRLYSQIERRYDAILAEGLAIHEAQSPLAPCAGPVFLSKNSASISGASAVLCGLAERLLFEVNLIRCAVVKALVWTFEIVE